MVGGALPGGREHVLKGVTIFSEMMGHKHEELRVIMTSLIFQKGLQDITERN